MASKKAGRLAGLAALAGAAYMLSKGKGEDKAKDAVKSESKSKSYDRDTDTGVDVMPSYAAKKSDDITVAGEGGFDTPADMSSIPRVGTPARTASSVKAPVIGGPTPARDPGGAGKRGAVSPGPTPVRAPGGVGKRGGKSMDELMSSYKPRLPGTRIEDAELKDNTGKRIKRYEDDGGRSMVARQNVAAEDEGLKRGGKVKKMASGGMTSSASKRGDGIAQRGKTKGRVC